ncbi:unnamed protein product [Rotaria magnacalcarata]|uniref:Tetraspanin n=1 Tax=Rotaria magnacalcarata TaxID=392030 RepID=A0A815NTC2_9BILA|nr:unnamed protein product [Rotaria magnacalcarata]CAF1442627.1 unnamed protein product [Rotaria magnacalcarata]CAF2045550.1 unnamed protein product [Rotaria magnacalcarata]CAF2051747.1 unnamed protein product [Rotaria magnacalcarata]CAF2144346.1 unnamed protein product [Rotaria magnacalcarata]
MIKPHSIGTAISGTLTILTGITLLITASVCTSDIHFIRDGWNEIYSLSIYSIIIGGLTVILTIGFLYVTTRNFPALTILFSILILLVFILTIVCIVMFAVALNDLKDDSFTYTDNLMRNYSNSNTAISSKNLLGTIQKSLRCCGTVEAADWVVKYPDGKSTPDTCCHVMVPGCGNYSLNLKDTIFLRGCANSLYSYIREDVIAILVFNTILAILIAISAIFGFITEGYIRQQYELM